MRKHISTLTGICSVVFLLIFTSLLSYRIGLRKGSTLIASFGSYQSVRHALHAIELVSPPALHELVLHEEGLLCQQLPSLYAAALESDHWPPSVCPENVDDVLSRAAVYIENSAPDGPIQAQMKIQEDQSHTEQEPEEFPSLLTVLKGVRRREDR